MQSQFRGIFPILATPFDENGDVDIESLRSLVEFEIRAGVNGLTILGVLSEVHRISEDERSLIIETVVKATNHRVPVVAGTGASGTFLAKKYSNNAKSQGIDAVMIAPPRLSKPNDDAIFSYYSEIARECDLPIIVQDEPSTYGVYFSPELIARLSRVERVHYVKLEDPPTPIKISKIRSLAGSEFGIFGGLGGLYAFEELRRGAIGIMTGFAFPELLCDMYNLINSGKVREARDLFYHILPLIRFEAQPMIGLAIRKEILKRRKAIRLSILRAPATNIDQETQSELDELFSALGLSLDGQAVTLRH